MIKLQLMFKTKILKELVTDKKEIGVGRDPANDICIDNLAISSRHARFFKGPDDKYSIEDLNSTNGTFVNEKEATTQVLYNNDQIRIGKHTIQVIYQMDGAFNEKEPRRANESTYIIDPKKSKK